MKIKTSPLHLLLFVALLSCGESVQTKTEYKLDRSGNPEYKEAAYRYIIGRDSSGQQVEIRHGLSQEFYPDGKIKAEVDFVQGMVDGKFKTFYENGKIAELSNWKNGRLHGTLQYYDETGKLYHESTYENGTLDGAENKFHDNGKLRVAVVYRDDLLWEIKGNYDSVGKTLDEKTLENGSGILNLYYPTGTVQSVTEYQSGKPEGKSSWYYESGKPQAVLQYTDGRKNGTLTVYHENGKLAKESLFEDDFVVGIEKTFNYRGTLIQETHYKKAIDTADKAQLSNGVYGLISDAFDPFGLNHGIQEGLHKTYYDNGKVESEEYFHDGLQDSVFREYYDNGKLKTDIFYDDRYESNKRYEKRFDKTGKEIISNVFLSREKTFTDKEKELRDTLNSKSKD